MKYRGLDYDTHRHWLLREKQEAINAIAIPREIFIVSKKIKRSRRAERGVACFARSRGDNSRGARSKAQRRVGAMQ